MAASHINRLLAEREKANDPINVAVFGAGWYGQGLVQELYRCPALVPKIVFDRDINSSAEALVEAGVDKSKVKMVKTVQEIKSALSQNDCYIATDNNELMAELKGVNVFYDATGDIEAGAQAASLVIDQGIHFITVSAELDSTVGYILNKKAEEKNVIFSNSDGDQPGVLIRLIEYVKLMGFDIVVAGNCKGFIDVHKTPEDIMPWVRPGHNPKMIAAFTDGTKQSTELTVLANATGLVPDRRGMHGPSTSKETLVDDFLRIISKEGVVDYVLGIKGINQGAGVFIVAKREGKRVYDDLDYLKKGKGPYYLFFKDEHMCYFVSTTTIAEAALMNIATLSPRTLSADVIAVAKRDLNPGDTLDGIGGYLSYGVIDTAQRTRDENLLPMGLSKGVIIKQTISKDTPISYDMVDFPQESLLLTLRHKQDQFITNHKK